jgi:hypothetical protein
MAFNYLRIFSIILTLFLITACGNRRSPTGGPIDSVRPDILFTVPLEYEQITNNEIVIAFSKPMDRASVLTGLMINPPIINRRIVWKKNNLHIHINEPLADDTNVTVFLNRSIRCERLNTFADHTVMVFRNGILQQNSVSGNISFDDGDIYEHQINIILLDSDSLLVFHEIVSEPFYKFDYLNPGRHIINSFIDLNNNNRFDFGFDASFHSSFTLPIATNIDLQLAVIDTVKPRISSLTSPFNNFINVLFNKELYTTPDISISDDSTGVKIQIIHTELRDKELFIITSPLDTLEYKMVFSPLTDKRGNVSNEIIRTFETRNASDTNLPQITATSPRNGNVIRDKQPLISITFNKIMFATDIEIRLREIESNQNIPLRVNNNAGFTITYTPQNELREFNSYQLIIGNNTKDLNGNQMYEDTVVQFIVVGVLNGE